MYLYYIGPDALVLNLLEPKSNPSFSRTTLLYDALHLLVYPARFLNFSRMNVKCCSRGALIRVTLTLVIRNEVSTYGSLIVLTDPTHQLLEMYEEDFGTLLSVNSAGVSASLFIGFCHFSTDTGMSLLTPSTLHDTSSNALTFVGDVSLSVCAEMKCRAPLILYFFTEVAIA